MAAVEQAQQEFNEAKSRLDTARESSQRGSTTSCTSSKNKTADANRQLKDKKVEHDNQEQILSSKTDELNQCKV